MNPNLTPSPAAHRRTITELTGQLADLQNDIFTYRRLAIHLKLEGQQERHESVTAAIEASATLAADIEEKLKIERKRYKTAVSRQKRATKQEEQTA